MNNAGNISRKKFRIKYWAYVLGFVMLIYSTLYAVRPVCAFLKSTTPFSLLVNIILVAILLLIMVSFGMKIRAAKTSSYIIFGAVLFSYFYGFAIIQHPEEKIHFIEYGFLACLARQAIGIDVKGPLVYIYAFLLASFLGWVDEGIQYLLPGRYYQIEDVILNSVSAALGLLLVFVFNREKEKAA